MVSDTTEGQIVRASVAATSVLFVLVIGLQARNVAAGEPVELPLLVASLAAVITAVMAYVERHGATGPGEA